MRIELIYRLKPGVKAHNVDLTFDNQRITRSAASNPHRKTFLQVFNSWFNVKVALIEADGTETRVDYANKELHGFYTSHFRTGNIDKTAASNFIFTYQRRFGQMFIKVVSHDPREQPALIVRRHFFAATKTPNPELIDLETEKEYPLPHTCDPALNERQIVDSTYGTAVHFLDKSQPVIAEHELLRTNLKAFDEHLRLALSQRKYRIANRIIQGDTNLFFSSTIFGEAASLSKSECHALLNEIEERNLFPKVIGRTLLETLLVRSDHVKIQEALEIAKKGGEIDDVMKKDAAIVLLEDKLQKFIKEQKSKKKETIDPIAIAPIEYPQTKTIATIKASGVEKLSDVIQNLAGATITPCLNHSVLPEFRADGSDIFSPDDFLTTPSAPKRSKTVAE